MSEPRRLRESDDPLVRALLASARHDRAPSGAAESALLAAQAAVMGGVPSHAENVHVRTGGGKSMAQLLSSQPARMAGLALAVAAVVGAHLALVHTTHEPQRRAVSSHAHGAPQAPERAPVDPLQHSAAPARPSELETAVPEPSERPRVARRARARLQQARAAKHAEEHATPDALADLEQLREARAALQSGRAQRALQLLSDFVARRASSPLLEEAQVLRIDALVALRRFEEASSHVARFKVTYPRSAYLGRLERAVHRE